MGTTLLEFKCPTCHKKFFTVDKRRKFCSRSCSAKSSNHRIHSLAQRENTRQALKNWWARQPKREKERRQNAVRELGIRSQQGKRKGAPRSILKLSKRTVMKILRRLELKCSRCGWDKEICDIHHIVSRKHGGTDDHANLTYICPNCHREAQRGRIDPSELVTLDVFLQDDWLRVYYG
jgi:Zn finger protein HypA/HybF involved in hydrogenase expression